MNLWLLLLDLKSLNPFFLCFSSLNRCFISLFYPVPLFFTSLSTEEKPAKLLSCFVAFLHCMTHKVKKEAWNLGCYYLSKHSKITSFNWLSVEVVISKTWDGPGEATVLWQVCDMGILENTFCLCQWANGKVQFAVVLWNQHVLVIQKKDFSKIKPSPFEVSLVAIKQRRQKPVFWVYSYWKLLYCARSAHILNIFSLVKWDTIMKSCLKNTWINF